MIAVIKLSPTVEQVDPNGRFSPGAFPVRRPSDQPAGQKVTPSFHRVRDKKLITSNSGRRKKQLLQSIGEL